MIIFEIILAFGIMIFIHELGHFWVAKKQGIPVERFSIGFGPKLIGYKYNGTEYCISLLPLGGYVKMLGEEPEEGKEPDPLGFLTQPPIKRIKILFAGAALNYLMALLLFPIVFMMGLYFLVPNTVIKQLKAGSPAQKAGLKPDDRIIAVNEKSVKTFEDLQNEVFPMAEKKLILTVERGKEISKIEVTPEKHIVDDVINGGKKSIGIIGITEAGSDRVFQKYRFGESIWQGLERAGTFTYVTYYFLWKTITFQLKLETLKASTAGPVGIFNIMMDHAKISFSNFLFVVAGVGLAATVPNGVEEVKKIAHYITTRPGGKGAVRELIEFILKSQNKWEEIVKQHGVI